MVELLYYLTIIHNTIVMHDLAFFYYNNRKHLFLFLFKKSIYPTDKLIISHSFYIEWLIRKLCARTRNSIEKRRSFYVPLKLAFDVNKCLAAIEFTDFLHGAHGIQINRLIKVPWY